MQPAECARQVFDVGDPKPEYPSMNPMYALGNLGLRNEDGKLPQGINTFRW